MKQTFYLSAIATAILCSCSSDDIPEIENGGTEPQTSFIATIEDDATRTTMVDGNDSSHKKAQWISGDEISIDGHIYTTTSNSTTATFTGTGATEATHHAYYPAAIYNNGTPALPAVQTYVPGETSNIPMYAESTTTDLSFKNICAVLAVKVTSADIATLKSIKVTSTSNALSGDIKLVADGSGYKAELTTEANNREGVTLTCSSAVNLTEEGTTFYIAVPAQSYGDLRFYLSADGTTYQECMATKNINAISIARNKIFNIDYEKNAVQLWADGPYFATTNVGATITDYASANSTSADVSQKYAESYVGKFYQWGANVAKTGAYVQGARNLTGDTDTATKLWGGNWQMPTQSDFESLRAGIDGDSPSGTSPNVGTNCTWTWCDGSSTQYVSGCTLAGWKISGNGDYSGNSIFLPSAGFWYTENSAMYNQGNDGCYWSSTHSTNNENGQAYCLNFFAAGWNSVTPGGRDMGYSVRAVLKNEQSANTEIPGASGQTDPFTPRSIRSRDTY